MNNQNYTPILAIDTSNDICSVSIFFNETKYITQNIRIKNIHSEKIFNAINNCLENFSLKPSDIKSIAFSNGPGSFTGLRIGMAAAKGIATGLNILIYTLSTFDVIAFQISHFVPVGNIINIINQADTEEVYFAKYLIKGFKAIEKLEDIKVIKKTAIEFNDNELYFGKVNGIDKINSIIFSPEASFLAKYLYENIDNLQPADLMLVEPNYLKNFKLRR
ncbi:MAG TPA: tRNA (adenosine(37)-N6)-threonylcarbamoyltransferase complex dimerization subunit type 1 TsaB [Ignavibacteriales bacterium]|nr:tRNA (adenosine(37)-N6)-threonylcarbamoyltransferase complex dimerization subunit type 1 TsaB [Ignavibacteriales bacterium]HOL81446.1 tRNA (adenosine(37)-N6)-threonylcarbamoyltransferase complex dimerization subunit type 1 TsaB [Ignavibacteriales bacterium]HOM65344.1 tRNA (adenosine(37)-N6)-threonylcarbamoyltransferase complex dimerization subunit type 1 TsaB [Ignavibacteriales bacterium]HPD66972.1 tRNA (adenosine(37)-N6)-threonylcarbamoyltransferase complex dimerization subunit type 1 TsaB [